MEPLAQELRQNRQMPEAIAEALPNLIWISSPAGADLYYNNRWFLYTGQHPDEFLSPGWQSVIHPHDKADVLVRYQKALSEGRPFEAQCRIFCKADNLHRWHLMRATPRCDNEGNITEWAGSCTEIDFHKRLLEKVTETSLSMEQMFRQPGTARISVSTQIGSWEANVLTGHVKWSDEMKAIFGLADDELPTTVKEVGKYLFPEDLEEMNRQLQHLVNQGKPFDFIHRIRYRGGQRFVHQRGQVIRDTRGEPWLVCGTCQDVTEVHNKDEQLVQQQALLDGIAEKVHCLIAVVDVESQQYIYFNSGLERILGYTPQEALQGGLKFFFSILHPKDLQKVIEAHEKLFKQCAAAGPDGPLEELILKIQYRLRHKDGSYRWFHTTKQPFRKGRNSFHLFSVSIDITQQIATQRNLRRKHRLNKSLIKAYPHSLVLKDYQKVKLLYISPQFEKVIGYSIEEIRQMGDEGLSKLIDSQDLLKIVKYRESFRNNTEQKNGKVEYRMRHKDGSWRWICTHDYVWRKNREGKPWLVLGVQEDITERKSSQLNLERQNRELERLNRELNQFLYLASHDLKEPLRMVVAFSDLLQRSLHDKMDVEEQEYMGFMTDGATRMLRLMDDLRVYAEVKNKPADFEDVNLNETLKQCLHHFSAQLEATQAEVAVTDSLPFIRGSKELISQLCFHLLSNALKFNKSQPRIAISATREDGQWIFCVADNGIGIAPNHRRRIFQLFQRLHLRNEFEGTGIGLAICRKIVELHNGRIWVESEPGEGSRFYFSLPATD